MSAPCSPSVRRELLGDDFLEEAYRRASCHGPARALRAIAYLLVEIADQAQSAGEIDLEAELWCTSDELDYAADMIVEERDDRAREFLGHALDETPELRDLEPIEDVLELIGKARR